MKPAICIENLSKQYRLGLVGTGTLSHDIKRWWHLIRGKEDPYLKIGETNDRSTKGNSQYVWALKDINLEVMPGEVLGIIGKNGAGKSTLLKILSKVTGPTTGKIDYKGRIGSLLEVGTGFHPELTGRENIYLNGAILGMRKKEIDRKFDEIVDFSGVERYIDTPTKRYSSGMTVRLGFAVAAFLEPEILVVDEVLAVGDAEFQKKAIGKMQDVSKNEGRTVLFVSHNMVSVENLCSRAILLENASICKDGNVQDVIEKYIGSDKEISNIFKLDSPDLLREGNGKIKATQLEIYSNDGNQNLIFPYDHLLFQLSVHIYDSKANKVGFDVTYLLKDNYDRTITSFSTRFTNKKISVHNKCKITCKIKDFNIVPGRYKIFLWIGSNSDTYDKITHAGIIEILEKDVFKSGKILSESKYNKYGLFFSKQKWETE